MKSGVKAFLFSLSVALFGIGSLAQAAPSVARTATEQKATSAIPSTTEKPTAAENLQAGSAGKISINTATAEELARVMNGVGMKKAQAIVNYREEYGPFKSIDDLRQVPGMGGALVDRNLSHLML